MISGDLGTLLLLCAAFGAGLIDAVAGGGGLIQVPALFAVNPSVEPATLLGTNKLASIGGTAIAAKKYLKSVNLPYLLLLPCILFSFFGALAGAWVVKGLSVGFFKVILPAILLLLLCYTVFQPSLGQFHKPSKLSSFKLLQGALFGGFIGFYDGFFGPGTGSFLLLGFIRVFGFDFLHASAATKLVNATTNFAAILLFSTFGHMNWALGLLMMCLNILGSYAGTHLALSRGNGFIRKIFIFVVLCLTLKTATDAFRYLYA